VDRVAWKRRRLVGVLLVANAAVALLLTALVFLVLRASKTSYERQAEDVAKGIAAVAVVNIGSELGLADALLLGGQ
jgi:uncharacterized membrane protein YciS (DUF1049 family)